MNHASKPLLVLAALLCATPALALSDSDIAPLRAEQILRFDPHEYDATRMSLRDRAMYNAAREQQRQARHAEKLANGVASAIAEDQFVVSTSEQ